jgi:long-subunit acyl-CoA synthetase (AMP-forming)
MLSDEWLVTGDFGWAKVAFQKIGREKICPKNSS